MGTRRTSEPANSAERKIVITRTFDAGCNVTTQGFPVAFRQPESCLASFANH